MSVPVAFGILGAARIAPMALVQPARRVPEATIVAVAARDGARARAFAAKHGIAQAYDAYEALLDDPQVEAVYNPLPNALHAAWTIRALEAGKHVLCEKPFAANTDEARTMAAAASRTRRVLVEAFHYRYHPLFARLRALLLAGEIGRVRHLEATFCIPLARPSDIRWRRDLAGGALMDTGCYAVHFLRHLAGAEPAVVRAEARWTRGGVDRWLRADLQYPDGRTARLTCALWSAQLLRIAARIDGDEGRIDVTNFVAPHFFNRVKVRSRTRTRTERVSGAPSYEHQLRAFVAAVREGAPVPTGPSDAIANMQVIDALYAAAGRPRDRVS